MDRARLVAPAFEVTAGNAASVAQLCWRLDGIPLAIELAAARVRVLTVEQIAARLNDRFRLLTGGSRVMPPRQQTLVATVDWSYNLLAEPERVLFRRLAVFVGGWTLDAAEVVGSGDGIDSSDVLDLVTSLVDKSLVLAEEHVGGERYRFLETIREYALGKLDEADEAECFRKHHREWYLELATNSLPGMEGSEQRYWWTRLDQEQGNLRAALAWSAARSSEAAALLRLAALLGRFWLWGGNPREGIGWLELALSGAGTQPNEDRARALNWLGHLTNKLGEPDRARQLLEQSVAGAKEVGDQPRRGRKARDRLQLVLPRHASGRRAAGGV